MKKLYATLVLLTLVSFLSFAQQAMDSTLIMERDSMNGQYTLSRTSGEPMNAAKLQSLFEQANGIIEKDDILIDMLEAKLMQIKDLKDTVATSQSQLDKITTEKSVLETFLNTYVFYGAIGAGVLLLIVIALMIIGLTGKGKLRKKLKAKTSEVAEIESRLNAALATVESNLTEKDVLLNKAINEKAIAERRNTELQNQVNGFNTRFAEQQQSFDEQTKQLKSEENTLLSNKIMLENKVRRLEATEAEFNTYKKNIEDAPKVSISDDSFIEEKSILESRINELESTNAYLNEQLAKQADDIFQFKIKTEEAKEIMNDYRGKAEFADEFYKKVDEIELKIIKLEKLEKLYQKQVISQEEFIQMKNKYLYDL